jgi:hypothetical protein
MKEPTALLLSATRRAKSDVANKLISMFLHELSRALSQDWHLRVESREYGELVRRSFSNRCPYCLCSLAETVPVVEHLDGMNRYRAGLHVPGNVLVACRRCNSEKRRDDSRLVLTLAHFGWESFLSHDESRCSQPCATCFYWAGVWPNRDERKLSLAGNLEKIRIFRREFKEFELALPLLTQTLPKLLTVLYADCQSFAELEIKTRLQDFLSLYRSASI